MSAFVLKEPGWEDLANIVSRATTVDHALKETLNAIWKAYAKGHISKEDAETKAKILLRLFDSNLEIVDEKKLVQEAFRIALAKKITPYDSLYVALAKLTASNYTRLMKNRPRTRRAWLK